MGLGRRNKLNGRLAPGRRSVMEPFCVIGSCKSEDYNLQV